MDKDEFLKVESKLAKILSCAIKNDRVAQAYLLHGSPRCPFEETALFVAQTLNCENGGLACGECGSCKRFLRGTRPDFMLIDGTKGLIKKEYILELRDKYSKTAVENKTEKQRISYVILSADNIRSDVANAMLKFLEEPMPGLTAILTTTNIERMLPTIRSRCEEIRLDPLSREYIYKTLLDDGYDEEMSYFLSDMSGDKSKWQELGNDESFIAVVKALNLFVMAYDESPEKGVYCLMKEAAEKLKGFACYNQFYAGLSRYFKDITSQNRQFSVYKESIEKHREDIQIASKATLLLDETVKKSNANMSFTGTLARLGCILAGNN